MKRFIEGVDRGQSTLFPECLEDWIDEDNPVRVIDVFVDELGLGGLGFGRATPEATGRPGYHRPGPQGQGDHITATAAGLHTLELSEGSARGGLLIKGWVSFQSAKWASFRPALTTRLDLTVAPEPTGPVRTATHGDGVCAAPVHCCPPGDTSANRPRPERS